VAGLIQHLILDPNQLKDEKEIKIMAELKLKILKQHK
jgi:hypothetical protein